jgi:hypothetical protein
LRKDLLSYTALSQAISWPTGCPALVRLSAWKATQQRTCKVYSAMMAAMPPKQERVLRVYDGVSRVAQTTLDALEYA